MSDDAAIRVVWWMAPNGRHPTDVDSITEVADLVREFRSSRKTKVLTTSATTKCVTLKIDVPTGFYSIVQAGRRILVVENDGILFIRSSNSLYAVSTEASQLF